MKCSVRIRGYDKRLSSPVGGGMEGERKQTAAACLLAQIHLRYISAPKPPPQSCKKPYSHRRRHLYTSPSSSSSSSPPRPPRKDVVRLQRPPADLAQRHAAGADEPLPDAALDARVHRLPRVVPVLEHRRLPALPARVLQRQHVPAAAVDMSRSRGWPAKQSPPLAIAPRADRIPRRTDGGCIRTNGGAHLDSGARRGPDSRRMATNRARGGRAHMWRLGWAGSAVRCT